MIKSHKVMPFDVERMDAIDSDIELLCSVRTSKKRLVAMAAELHGLTPEVLISNSQKRELSHKRFRVEYLFHQMQMSYAYIGRLLNKNHTSVLHGVRRVKASLAASNNSEAV